MTPPSGAGRDRLRAFVVGCPRSGTTLIQARLTTHPLIDTFPETQLFQQLVGMQHQLAGLGGLRTAKEWRVDLVRGLLLQLGLGRNILPAYAKRLKEIGEHLGSPEFEEWKFPDTRRLDRLIDYATDRFDRAAARSGAIGWIEKTPTHLRYRRLIERYVPGAKFIHVVRDGRATVASIWEAVTKDYAYWRKNFPSIESCVTVWNKDLDRVKACVGLPRHLVFNYHQFCDAPERHCRTAWEFLGLDPDPPATGEDNDRAGGIILPYEEWKDSVNRPIEDYGLKKFEQVFTPAERETIERGLTAGGDVTKLGMACGS
ncbi:MAG: sulfotransferase [Planctomycetota bacterium]